MAAATESLADRAYRAVEAMIVTLVLPPGEVVSESELSRRTDIGRTPLREALQRLAADRLVEVLPRRGILITDIDLRNQLALLETRRVLDRLVTTRAARRARPDERASLRERATAMREAAQANRLDTFMQLDREFDRIVAAAARNPFAAEALAPLHAHGRRFWYKHKADGDLKHAAALHERLMQTVAEGDEEKAADASDALVDYLEEFTRLALDFM